ncbi:DUF6471 domain-containing protein [Paraburkholderia ribeironis]|nr:DUF6471 domain-containing protein [Paraburkholderia ribeironis]
MTEAEAAWSKLASKLMRVAFLRSDVTYARLAELLTQDGAPETERSVESRVFRGKARFSFLLRSLHVMGADLPPLWRAALTGADLTWEQKATAVFAAELSLQKRVTSEELLRRLQVFSLELDGLALNTQINSGEFSVVLFMQCMAAVGSTTLERFIDLSDFDNSALRTPAPVA